MAETSRPLAAVSGNRVMGRRKMVEGQDSSLINRPKHLPSTVPTASPRLNERPAITQRKAALEATVGAGGREQLLNNCSSHFILQQGQKHPAATLLTLPPRNQGPSSARQCPMAAGCVRKGLWRSEDGEEIPKASHRAQLQLRPLPLSGMQLHGGLGI